MQSLIKPSLLICTVLLAATASAATIEVKVSSVIGGRGKVNVAVCDKERFLKDCLYSGCLLYTSPSPRDRQKSRMPSSA